MQVRVEIACKLRSSSGPYTTLRTVSNPNNTVPRITEIPKFYRNPRIFTEIPLDITEIPIRSSEIPYRWKDLTLL